MQCLAHSGPFGPELGVTGALDGEQPHRAVPALVVGVPPPIPSPGHEVLDVQDPGAQPHEGGQCTDGAGPSPYLSPSGLQQAARSSPKRWVPKWVKKVHQVQKFFFFKNDPRPHGMPKEVFLARFELVVARFGPPKIPKCLENGL